MSPYQKELESLFGDRGIGTLVTLKRDGRPQLSNVLYHFDRHQQRFEISVTDTRAKTTNMKRDSRVSLHVNGDDGWSYAVVEGRAELTPHATAPDDATVDRLVELYRELQGEHQDWTEFREAMVREHRLLLVVHVERVYGMLRE